MFLLNFSNGYLNAFFTSRLMFTEPKRLTPRIGTYIEQRGRPWGKSRSYRGRPKGKSKAYYTDLNSIILVACKHNLIPERLADAFFDAWKNTISHYERLTITCRKVHHDTATFLIEKDEKAIWQSPLNLESIRNPNAKEYIKNSPIPEYVTKKNYPQDQKIGKLRFGMKRINVTATITKKPPAIGVHTRWGTTASVSNVTIADDTGSIRLSLWNEQIDMVQIDDAVELKNCYVARYAGAPQLRIGRKGTITVINQPQDEEPIHYSILR
jgi:replication factor A1